MDVKQLFSASANRFVYMLGDEGAVLVYLEKDVVIRRLFAPTPAPEHTNTFVELLKAHPKTPIYVLVDMIDQSYVRHTLPPVTPLGVNKLVQRRLERDFSKDDIKGAISLGREKEGRKDWNFLLIALANTPVLQNWLNLVLELPNFFSGIYLVPVETEIILKIVDDAISGRNGSGKKQKKTKATEKKGPRLSRKQKKEQEAEEDVAAQIEAFKNERGVSSEHEAGTESEWKIFVTHNKVGGFRQVVLRGGRLVFTRLAQTMDNTNPEVLAGSVEQEIQNTVEYLKRLGYAPRMGLDIYIVCSQEVKDAISTERLGATQTHLFSPFELGELLGLKQAVLSGDRFGDIVIATIFGTSRKKRLQLNIPYTQNIQKLEGIRKFSKLAAVVFALGLIAMSVLSFFDYQGLQGDIDMKQREKITQAAALTKIQEESKKLPADVDQVTDLISMVDSFSKTTQTPIQFITDLRPNLVEGVVVRSLNWVRKEEKPAPVFNPATGAQEEGPPVEKFEIALECEFLYTDDTWDGFIDRSLRFVEHLKKAYPEYTIISENMPGDNPEASSAQMNFDDIKKINNRPARGDAYVITIGMSGPNVSAPAVDANGNPIPPTPSPQAP